MTHSESPTRAWTRVPLDDSDPAETELSYEQLRELASRCGDVRISIALPTHLAGPQTQQDPIRLAALARQAEHALADEIGDVPAQRRLRAVTRLRDNSSFWTHARRGLVLLLDHDGLRAFKLGHTVTPVAYVGERFRTLPLLPLVAPDRFHVLAVSPTEVRLLAGDARRLRQLPHGDMPRRLEDVVGHDLQAASLQSHTVGPRGRGAIFHGQGAGQDDRDHERVRFLRCIVDAVSRRLAATQVPIVLAGVERTVADLRRLAPELPLAPDAVLGNPADLSLADLHAAAWDVAEPVLRAPALDVAARIAARLGTPQVATGLGEVLRAAQMGRIDGLVVGGDEPQWGLTDKTHEYVEVHAHCRDGDTDLVDLAVAHALAHGSTVHAVAPSEVPGNDRVAAILRY